jgi:hypothetical protein
VSGTPTPWLSAQRFGECAVHFVLFCLLWCAWSWIAQEPYEIPKMLVIAAAVAAGLTWGLPLLSSKKA